MDQNFVRWRGQFEGTPGEEAGALPSGTRWIRLSGTYLDKPSPMAPGPGTPKPDSVMHGAVIGPEGEALFVKAWGPKATLDTHRGAIDAFVASAAR